MQLRKLCNHPYLLLEGMANQSIPDNLYNTELISSSGKMCVLERLLYILLPNGHKILIFSQFSTQLDVLEGYLHHNGIGYARLDGGTNQVDREKLIFDFNHQDDSPSSSHGDTKIFLISTRAGAVGINLQAADTVIIFDSDWNPQMDLQAMSRSHRIGQKRAVLILRLVSEGPDECTSSVEEGMLARAQKKLQAERTVLADREFNMGTTNTNTNIPESSDLSNGKSQSTKDRSSTLLTLFEHLPSGYELEDVEEGGEEVVIKGNNELSHSHSKRPGGCESSSRRGGALLDLMFLLSKCRRLGGSSGGSGGEARDSLDDVPSMDCFTTLSTSAEQLLPWSLWLRGSCSSRANDPFTTSDSGSSSSMPLSSISSINILMHSTDFSAVKDSMERIPRRCRVNRSLSENNCLKQVK